VKLIDLGGKHLLSSQESYKTFKASRPNWAQNKYLHFSNFRKKVVT